MKITYSSWICLSAAIAASGSVATFAHAKESLSYAQAGKSVAAKTSVSSKRNSRSPASAEDAEMLILGSWNLSQITEQCEDLAGERKGEAWHFEKNGRFVRTFVNGLPPQEGQWKLKHGSKIVIRFAKGPQSRESEEQFIQILNGKQLELIAPTQVENGVVVKMQRLSSFFHS